MRRVALVAPSSPSLRQKFFLVVSWVERLKQQRAPDTGRLSACVRVTWFGDPGTILSPCVSSWIGGERLFLLYGWATFFIPSHTLFPSIFSGLSHRRYATPRRGSGHDEGQTSCLRSHSGPSMYALVESPSFPTTGPSFWSRCSTVIPLSHPSTQQCFDLGPLCRLRILCVTVVVVTLRQHRMYVGTRQVYKGVLSGPRNSGSCFIDLSPLSCSRSFTESSPSFDEVQISWTVIVVPTGWGSDRALLSTSEGDVEVVDHTNVLWASPIPAVWYYPLGLFVAAVGFNAEVTGYTLCLRISNKQIARQRQGLGLEPGCS